MAGYGSVDDDDDDRDGEHEDQEEYEENQRLLTMAKSKYDMKNHMANERTFFKYLFTGLHIGGIGTLVLSFFATADVNKLYLVLFIWLVAFGFMFWGLYSYYRRKRLMETGHFKETQLLNPHTPVIITIIFVSVIALVVAYAMISNQYPAKGSRAPPLVTRTRNAAGNANGAKRTNVRANPARSATTSVAPVAGKIGNTVKSAPKTALGSNVDNVPTLELLDVDTGLQLSGSAVNTDFLKDKSLPPGAIVAAQLTLEDHEHEYDEEEYEDEE